MIGVIMCKSTIPLLLTANLLLVGCGSNTNSTSIEQPSDKQNSTEKNLAKAQLGVLADATVKIEELGVVPYKLIATEMTSDGDEIDKIGNFDAHYKELEKDKYYLYTVTGGIDKDANDDGVIDLIPTINKGSFHAIIKGEIAKNLQGKFYVTSVTELQYKKVKSSLNQTDDLPNKLDIASKEILKDNTDILQYNPVEDKEKLHEAYHDNLPKIIDDIHKDTKEPVEKQAPTANAGKDRSMTVGTSLTLSGSAFDTDGHIVSYGWHEDGKLISENKSFTYNPTALGKHILTLTVTDNDSLKDEDTITITVTEKPNTIPAAKSQTISLQEEIAKNIVLQGSDADNDTLSYKILTKPVHGTLSGTAPHLTYTPYTNYFGEDSIIYVVNDGKDDSQKGYITLKIANTNDAPTAYGQTVVMDEDDVKSILLKASDIDSQTLQYTIVKQPSHGTLSGDAPNLTYTPDADYYGSDSFSYKVDDGESSSSDAVVDILIKNTADTPIASSHKVAIKKDIPKIIKLVNDASETYSIISFPKHGTLTQTLPNPTYTPEEGYLGEDSFSYKVSNADTESTVATINLYVTKFQRTLFQIDRDNDGTIDETYISKYNIEGKKIFESEDRDGDGKAELVRKWTYTKEKDGNISGIVTVQKEGEKTRTSHITYDSMWRLLKSRSESKLYYGNTSGKGQDIISITKKAYDDHGKNIKGEWLTYDMNGTLMFSRSSFNEYKYDENDNVIEETYSGYFGKKLYHRQFTYDEHNRLIKVHGINYDYDCTYTYNELGNLLKKYCSEDDYEINQYAENGKDLIHKEDHKTYNQVIEDYTYDAHHRVRTKHRVVHPNSNVFTSYLYDENDNISTKEIIYYEEDGQTIKAHNISYQEYDDYHNRIKLKVDDNNDGVIDAIYYYTWE